MAQACTNASAHAMAPISRLMARVWGNSGEPQRSANICKDQKVSLSNIEHFEGVCQSPQKSQNMRKENKAVPVLAKQEAAPQPRREVGIDSMTNVPSDLYWSLLRAGDRAKNRGQHRLKDSRNLRGPMQSGEVPSPHLVMTCLASIEAQAVQQVSACA
ncbi:unnamed protein product [Polarella glacialis]|uniref:Uncharacterized protein n=1 Tax=Polarella glacialis TaxID=89957 RepID=A0A813ERZ0_POLGL|nr:unnamed protein product [Polarella glacialis]